MAHHGKRVLKSRESVERTKLYALQDAVKLVKSHASAKFDETVELAINLGVDPKHADQMVRGVVNLPNGTGRTLRVAVFARGAKADEARTAGADAVGAGDLVPAAQGGTVAVGEDRVAGKIKGFLDAVGKGQPAGAKGTYLQRAAISSTMGPGVRLDLASLATAAQVGT